MTTPANDAPSLLRRFQASMTMNHEKWHDGTGYDLFLLHDASPEDLAAIESLLISRPIADWRDVEALATLGTERALAALRDSWETGDDRIRLEIARFAPELTADHERAILLAKTLETATLDSGLSEAIDEAVEFHPPEVIDALWRGLLTHDAVAAYHFAALLYVIHGKCDSIYDTGHRDFFLKFSTEDPAERRTAYAELRCQLGHPAQT